MKPGRVVLDQLRLVTEETFHSRNKRLAPREGDVVFAREGTVGTAVSLPAQPLVCLGQRVMLLRPFEALATRFLEQALMAPVTKEQYGSKLTGSTVSHVNVRDVKRLGIPLPPVQEQAALLDRLMTLLETADRCEATHSVAHTRSSTLDQAILAKAFRGELVPQDPDDEPASALLERIRAEREAVAPKKKRVRKKKPAAKRAKPSKKATKRTKAKASPASNGTNGNLLPHALEALKRDALHRIADAEGIELPDRRLLASAREGLLAGGVTLEAALRHLKRDELKAMCRALDLEEGGRSKDEIRDRILAQEGERRS